MWRPWAHCGALKPNNKQVSDLNHIQILRTTKLQGPDYYYLIGHNPGLLLASLLDKHLVKTSIHNEAE
jgi:hypothetical protein